MGTFKWGLSTFGGPDTFEAGSTPGNVSGVTAAVTVAGPAGTATAGGGASAPTGAVTVAGPAGAAVGGAGASVTTVPGAVAVAGSAGDVGAGAALSGPVGSVVSAGPAGNATAGAALVGLAGTVVAAGPAGSISAGAAVAGPAGAVVAAGPAGTAQGPASLAGPAGAVVVAAPVGVVEEDVLGPVGTVTVAGPAGGIAIAPAVPGPVGAVAVGGPSGSVANTVGAPTGNVTVASPGGSAAGLASIFGPVGTITVAGPAGVATISITGVVGNVNVGAPSYGTGISPVAGITAGGVLTCTGSPAGATEIQVAGPSGNVTVVGPAGAISPTAHIIGGAILAANPTPSGHLIGGGALAAAANVTGQLAAGAELAGNGWAGPLRVPGGLPAPVPIAHRIGVAVVNRAGGPIVDLSDASFARQWQDQLSLEGSGSVSLPYWSPGPANTIRVNPLLALIPYRSILRFSLDGTPRFAVVCEHKVTTAVAPGEEGSEEVVLGGRGTLSVFEEAVVYPGGGLGITPFSDTRVFNYASPELDSSGWPMAAQILQQNSRVGPWVGQPGGWPDASAWWIWGAPYTNSAPDGACYFRRLFNVHSPTSLTDGATIRIFLTADNAVDLYLDGIPIVLRPLGTLSYTGGVVIDLALSAGNHLLAAKATNSGGPAGFLLTAYILNADSSLGPLVVRSDNTWKALAYPNPLPGLTPGKIIRVLVDEAHARGALANVTLTFNDVYDSAGAAWTAHDTTVSVGTDLLSVIKQLAEFQITGAHMDPTSLRFSAYAPGDYGAVTGVTFTPGVNLTSLSHDGAA